MFPFTYPNFVFILSKVGLLYFRFPLYSSFILGKTGQYSGTIMSFISILKGTLSLKVVIINMLYILVY